MRYLRGVVIIMSLRAFGKHAPVRGGCVATCARNDMRAKVNALSAHAFGRFQSPPLHFGDAHLHGTTLARFLKC
jgi:hypothetical protein